MPLGLRKKLKELMGEFTDLRSRIHEEYREVGERQGVSKGCSECRR